MSNYTEKDKKREYLRITSRFLKELGLYAYWIRYCYDPKTGKSWNNRKNLEITDILGCTGFTDYLSKHNKNIGNGYMMYEIFGEYVIKMHPEYKNQVIDHSNFMLLIDEEKKKVTFNSEIDSPYIDW